MRREDLEHLIITEKLKEKQGKGDIENELIMDSLAALSDRGKSSA